MEIKREFSVREIAGEYLLVPMGKTALDLNGMITLNDVAADIWNMLPTAKTSAEIVCRIMHDYDADEKTVRADVEEFLCKLKKLDII